MAKKTYTIDGEQYGCIDVTFRHLLSFGRDLKDFSESIFVVVFFTVVINVGEQQAFQGNLFMYAWLDRQLNGQELHACFNTFD